MSVLSVPVPTPDHLPHTHIIHTHIMHTLNLGTWLSYRREQREKQKFVDEKKRLAGLRSKPGSGAARAAPSARNGNEEVSYLIALRQANLLSDF